MTQSGTNVEREEKHPFWVNCASCGHEWILFYSPIAVDIMTKFAKNPCPMCGESEHIKINYDANIFAIVW